MSTYQEDLLDQPAALQNTITALTENSAIDHVTGFLSTRHWSRYILTGMGSSFHSLYPLYRRLLKAHQPAWLVETSELLNLPELITQDTLIIANSQSGASAEIVRLLDSADADRQILGITNTAESPLSLRAACALVTRAGNETSVSCKTYLAALAAQCWLGDRLIAGTDFFKEWINLPQAVALYLDEWRKTVQSLEKTLVDIHQIYLVGRGDSIASAGTAGLILKESTRFPSEGMSSAAFRHGPFEMVGPHSLVVVFGGGVDVIDLNRKLVRDVQRSGGRSVLIESTDRKDRNAFTLPVCNPSALPVLEILPVQMISLALSEIHHFTPGVFTLASKVTSVE